MLTKADILMYAPLTEKEKQAEDVAIAEIRAGAPVNMEPAYTLPSLAPLRPTRHEQLIAAELLALKKLTLAQDAKLSSLQNQLDVLAQELARMQQKG